MYTNGDGGPKDDVVAADLMRRSAAQSHPAAIFGLAVMYAEGRGVSRNLPVAFALVGAVPFPDENTVAYREMLTTHMTPAQNEKAARMAETMHASGVSEVAILRLLQEHSHEPH